MNNCITNISKSWIIGCSLLTCGIITSSYLHGLNELQILHMQYKHKKEMKLMDDDNYDDRCISYYSRQYTTVFILGITGISVLAFRSTLALTKV